VVAVSDGEHKNPKMKPFKRSPNNVKKKIAAQNPILKSILALFRNG
jgi:hypothetical protein